MRKWFSPPSYIVAALNVAVIPATRPLRLPVVITGGGGGGVDGRVCGDRGMCDCRVCGDRGVCDCRVCGD